jgi:hypothetical protein
MTEILGDFIEQFPPEQDSLELKFTPSSAPIRKRWRSHRLSAHFTADYFSNFLPIDDDDPISEKRIKESKGIVSYIANELLENAMKFNDEASQYKVRFGIHFIESSGIVAAVFATNSIKPSMVEPFQAFIKTLLSSDLDELYMQQVERSAETDSETSGLGLLTMMNDYAAKLGWRFETMMNTDWGDRATAISQPVITVTTMAQIKI